MTDELPYDEVPRFLIARTPVARSSGLAIGLGPVLVYRSKLVLRFEATVGSPSKQAPVLLVPHPRHPEVPFMNLQCSIDSEEGGRELVDAKEVLGMSGRTGSRCWAYFGIVDVPDSGTMTIRWSYEHNGLGVSTHAIDLEDAARLRSQVGPAFLKEPHG